ncbi:MAG TPA: ribosome-associated translation inhibitor RaiA [Chitinophagaceae bacterium]|nr:ribosome-associated translation inhibitor RaiA [Chitinophagaceae bacterium]
MNVQIESPQAERNVKLENLIQEKFEHLEKQFQRITNCKVLYHKQKNDVQQRYFIEAKMEVPQKILFASDKAETYELALSKVIDELDHQLRRYKEKLLEQR